MYGYSPRRPSPAASRHRCCLALITALVLPMVPAGLPRADAIYKSIDANGNVVYSDHLDASMRDTTTVHLDDARYPPHEMHVCWTNCFTLILDHGVYRRADGTDETWSVETFTAHAVVLHRHGAPAAWNGFHGDVTYAGGVANDRLVGVTVDGKPTNGIDASWGIALNTLPGSDAERDGPWPDPAAASGGPGATAGAAVTAPLAPPDVPNDPQPAAPQDGYLWTPGYWYWGGHGYYWVIGRWLPPPRVGLLWTPAYWSLLGAVYVFHPGYWGRQVGFYGGINYGHGYFGTGYSGGHGAGGGSAAHSSVIHRVPGVTPTTYAAPAALPPPRKADAPPARLHRVTPLKAHP